MNVTDSDEITAYVEGVRRALAGVSEPTRLDLLEDLPEHLAEVQAEGIGTLVERLGPPEVYAKELLASAGLIGGFPDPPAPNRFAGLIETRDNVLRLVHDADVRTGPVIGYAKTSDFLLLLRPAWWVARGYLVAMLIAYMVEGNSREIGLLPRISGNDLLALVLLTGCVIVSIGLGKRTDTLGGGPRLALRIGTVVLILVAFGGFATADSSTRQPGYFDVSYHGGNPNEFGHVNDVYVYDNQGRLVEGARLYDQDGAPIQLGNNYCTDPNTGETMRSRSLGYPFCPQNAPLGASPSVTPAEGAGPAGPSPAPDDASASPTGPSPSSARPSPSPSS
ncbi:HAAS signaling domain-containing protein [Paractinoplanes rishiriensis]|uniref:Uncharacterized protein n=1 Tax=Paractinoplanes rishiriensis TaxID=1050105 RepID=A0A919JYR3_9ACTN|nr:hypothetical protein [Actinoplanes rishiriensis]GIE95950.1 hypothetical protein Ari01nite_34150 [Actinoplanes rishiriensis]